LSIRILKQARQTHRHYPQRARLLSNISALPEDAMDEINAIQTRQRLNPVTATGYPCLHRKKQMSVDS
jgi:hypothetical protein